MSRTYFPNSTQFDMINENLVKIAAAIEGKIDYSTWEGIQKAVRMGLGAKMFPVGTVLTAKHTTYGDIAFQVVGHNQLRSAVNPSSPTMTLMSVNPIFETEMSTPQAFYLAESELTAGTYCFEISKSIGEWDAGVYSFTLSAPLPQNGHLCIDNGFNAPITSCKVVAYPNIYARSPMLTVSIVSGANGTNLGAIDASLNSSGRITYGSNNYENSAVRQLLNSSEKAGSVWTPKTKFDRPPSWLSEIDGFLCGLDASFKSVVGEVSWPCHTNTDYDENGTEQNYSVNDKFSLASAKEILGVSNFSADQSVQFDYFKDCSKQDLIKNNANWYLRTPDTGSSFMCDTIDPSGTKGMVPASVPCSIVPVCTVV